MVPKAEANRSSTPIRLTPILRMGESFRMELQLDKDGTVFGDDRRKGFVARAEEGAKRRDALLKSTLLWDFVLILLATGIAVPIPGIGLHFHDIPGVLELLVILSSFSFLFFATSFFNEQCYRSILTVIARKESKNTGIDPDFISSSWIFDELFLKSFRKNFNFWGKDWFSPGKFFIIVFGIISIFLNFSVFVLFIVHIIVVSYGALVMLGTASWQPISLAVGVFGLAANLAAMLILVLMGKSFHFEIIDESEQNSP